MNPSDYQRHLRVLDAEIADSSGPTEGNLDPDGVVLVSGSDLRMEPVSWLWQGWIARGKLHILAGPPGQGKTTIALSHAAVLTTGGLWPDGTQAERGNIAIWSGEDDPQDTLLPRLVAAGADPSRCKFITARRRNGRTEPFDPARDFAHLADAIAKIGGISLLIVDPVVSAVAGDSHKNAEVRRALQPLVDLAANSNCAILGITHFSKGGQKQDLWERVTGSIAFGAVARVIMVASKVASDAGEDRRIFARAKSNLGPGEGGFEYGIEQVSVLPHLVASRITWGAWVEGSARDLLAQQEGSTDEAALDARDLLLAELSSDGWTPADKASHPLRDAGFSKKQIWAASKKLGVLRTKGAMNSGWYWRLPAAAHPLPVRRPSEGSEGSEGSSPIGVESSPEVEPSVEVDL